MGNYPEILWSLLWRVLISVPLFYVGATGAGDIYSPFFVVLGGIVLAPAIARLIAEPTGSLFYPIRRYSRPQPVYGIPESKRAKGLYDEAIAGFEKIAEEFPDEAKPYVEMIDIAIVDLGDAEMANRFYQRGMAALANCEEKEFLARMYSAIRTRLNIRHPA